MSQAKRVEGRDLKVGDTIAAWWGNDTIISLKPYVGTLSYLWPEGAAIASFARNQSGMTIEPTLTFNVVGCLA